MQGTEQKESIDIVGLIESNPVTMLHANSQSKLVEKIKTKFTSYEQQLFISSFYCYFKYNSKTDFVIDLDSVWKWLDFGQKDSAKRLLEKIFVIDKDYKSLLRFKAEQKNSTILTTEAEKGEVKKEKRGGHNKETFMLNVETFKKFCLKAGTKKADEIHDYFIKMEEVFHEVLMEESEDLQKQLLTLETTKEKEKSRAVEQVIIAQFPQNTECIYFGTIANTNEKGEKLIKFGISNDLSLRVLDHRKKYMNFRLVCAFRVQNKTEIENLMKKHPKIQKYLRMIKVNDKCKTEIIAYDDVNLTIDKLQKYMKDIIDSRKLCIENFVKMETEIQMLYSQNEILKTNVEMMTGKYTKLLVEHDQLQEMVKKQKAVIDKIHKEENDNTVFPEPEINEEEVNHAMAACVEFTAMFNEFVSAECIVRSDVYESSVQLEGRFRLWKQTKPKKEIFHAFKNYMDTRFQPKRMPINKQNAHCYVGIKLREAEYKKKFSSADAPPVETFLFQMCKFSDNGKILNSVLLREYKKWKQSVHRECATDEIELKEIKGYLNACPYALKATVWTEHGVNEGYYGLSLTEDYIKQTEQVQKSNKNTTGKVVEKREIKTNELIGTWDSIADAAVSENVCAAKMSRYIREKKQIGDYHFVTKC
jgi:regulator of replication initiation timing/phage anti-repressor protein